MSPLSRVSVLSVPIDLTAVRDLDLINGRCSSRQTGTLGRDRRCTLLLLEGKDKRRAPQPRFQGSVKRTRHDIIVCTCVLQARRWRREVAALYRARAASLLPQLASASYASGRAEECNRCRFRDLVDRNTLLACLAFFVFVGLF